MRLPTLLAVSFALLLLSIGPSRALSLPPSQEFTLDNGLTVLLTPKHDVPLVAANRVGREVATTDPTLQMDFYGSSFICDHKGKLLAQADRESTGVLIQTLDLSVMREDRLTWGIFRDRRPDLYGALLTLDGRPS